MYTEDMATREQVLLDIRAKRNSLFRWDWPFLSSREKLRFQCDKITPVIKKHHGMTFDSSDMPDPLYPETERGHMLGVTPSDDGGGDVWSLTGTQKYVGHVSAMADTDTIIEELRSLTGAQRWRKIKDFRK